LQLQSLSYYHSQILAEAISEINSEKELVEFTKDMSDGVYNKLAKKFESKYMNLAQSSADPPFAEKPLQVDGDNTPGKVRPAEAPGIRQSDGELTAPTR